MLNFTPAKYQKKTINKNFFPFLTPKSRHFQIPPHQVNRQTLRFQMSYNTWKHPTFQYPSNPSKLHRSNSKTLPTASKQKQNILSCKSTKKAWRALTARSTRETNKQLALIRFLHAPKPKRRRGGMAHKSVWRQRRPEQMRINMEVESSVGHAVDG
jgi:hypothetical protein